MNSGNSMHPGRMIIENIVVLLLYWAISHLNFIVFKSLGVLPMPIWPAAAVAIVAAFYRGWKVAPGIAIGSVLANHISLGGSLQFALLIAILNTVGPILGAYIARKKVGEELQFSSFSDSLIFMVAIIIITPALTATGGIGSKWLLGLLPIEKVPVSWLRWAFAHALGTFVFALPIFLLIKTNLHKTKSEK